MFYFALSHGRVHSVDANGTDTMSYRKSTSNLNCLIASYKETLYVFVKVMQLESFVGARLRCFTVGALEELNVAWHGVLVIFLNPFCT